MQLTGLGWVELHLLSGPDLVVDWGSQTLQNLSYLPHKQKKQVFWICRSPCAVAYSDHP